MSYEILAQKEEFKNYENNIIKLFRNLALDFLDKANQPDAGLGFLRGRLAGVKEALMLNISKIEDETIRKKLKEDLKKKIVGIELGAFLND